MVSRSKRRKQRSQPHAVTPATPRALSYAWPCGLLAVALFALYAGSYGYPLVFDDKLINPLQLQEDLGCSSLRARCLSYGTFSLTFRAAGLELAWFRLGNVAAHALASLSCFLFFDELFRAVRRNSPGAVAQSGARDRLIAFCGALLFAVHPVTVYGVAYLTQRSIVMATLFSLLSLSAFVRGLSRRSAAWFCLSVVLYLLALLSKEHAIMVPAVAIAVALLLGERSWHISPGRALLLGAFAAVGAYFILQRAGIVGSTAAEYFLREVESGEAVAGAASSTAAYVRSAMTQAGLFFRYLLTWLVPYPGWMSVDLRVPIAGSPLHWPFVAGLLAFVAYGCAATVLLWRGGTLGLAGFGMLFPWLFFFTELSSSRIQEAFVLYRSYLWMPGLIAVLPLAVSRLSRRQIVALCAVLALLLSAAMRERLATFQSNLALWDDVVRKNDDLSLLFVDRGYGNRAVALLREGRLEESLRDLDVTLKLNPRSSHAYVNRATILARRGEEAKALADFERAIELDPAFAEAHAELCATLLKIGQLERALGSCNDALRIAPMLPTALLNRAVLNARASRPGAALEDLDKILGIEPANGIALYNRGMVLREMGRAGDAERDLRASCNAGFAPACTAPR
jgi:tetratricopeptide (TPR) repeat protein